MAVFWIFLVVFTKLIYVENRMIPLNFITIQPIIDADEVTPPNEGIEDNPYERVIGLRGYNKHHPSYELERKSISNDKTKKPCSIVVLSNVQNPNMQSLLRKYRYDANGMLIPSSVKYFIKMPQGYGAAPLLVPLNDKAFSPLGGFVRYYKEVPPIPQSW